MSESYGKHGGINVVLLNKRNSMKKVLCKERKSTYYSVSSILMVEHGVFNYFDGHPHDTQGVKW